MSNPKKKTAAGICLAICIGLFAWNFSHPYVEEESSDSNASNENSTTTSSNFSTDTTSDYNSYNSASNYDYSEADTAAAEVEEATPSQDELWLEKYRGNSLKNGAQPYHKLYGYNSKGGSSAFGFEASSGSDVIVTIKNMSGKIIRHAYIKKGHRLEITVPSGTYQVFFIFGNSWCPEKEAPNGQKGYFLEGVSVSKDEPQRVPQNQILNYTLYSIQNGNFSPDPSTAEEALN